MNSHPFFLCGKDIAVSGSIGISVFSTDASDERMILESTNAAMCRRNRGGF